MTAHANRTVLLLWDDDLGDTHRAELGFSGVSTSVAGRYSAAWYAFNATVDTPFQALDPEAAITRMRFVVDGRVEDQGGMGFAVQDGVVFSNTLCATSQKPNAGHLDVVVRNDLNVTRVYLEHQGVDNVARISIVETDIPPTPHPTPANKSHPYSIWSVNLTDDHKSVYYTIGFELSDGAKSSTNDQHSLVDFPLCIM
ncbi:hypothetical protein FB451DRAFT_1173537 [Mycena latifolia]|nr:hypothetical protein FB451DRAFT_1173537 [Mycena latifolia]